MGRGGRDWITGFGSEISGFGVRISGPGLQAIDFGFRIPGFGFWSSGTLWQLRLVRVTSAPRRGFEFGSDACLGVESLEIRAQGPYIYV